MEIAESGRNKHQLSAYCTLKKTTQIQFQSSHPANVRKYKYVGRAPPADSFASWVALAWLLQTKVVVIATTTTTITTITVSIFFCKNATRSKQTTLELMLKSTAITKQHL
ncbi:unnamed protein product [Polarella glacialis]|uniref:Uncharacterized protein n=1 Tax=Polarella glacialis TaxID=89957 RepID=A0A813F6S9_POLGL|nr:unnamed protein product [Polarella glacialis]